MKFLLFVGVFFSFIIYLNILIKLFKKEGVFKGILGLICAVYTFIWGCIHSEEERLTSFIWVWTGIIILNIILVLAIQSTATASEAPRFLSTSDEPVETQKALIYRTPSETPPNFIFGENKILPPTFGFKVDKNSLQTRCTGKTVYNNVDEDISPDSARATMQSLFSNIFIRFKSKENQIVSIMADTPIAITSVNDGNIHGGVISISIDQSSQVSQLGIELNFEQSGSVNGSVSYATGSSVSHVYAGNIYSCQISGSWQMLDVDQMPPEKITTLTGVYENEQVVLKWDPVDGANKYLIFKQRMMENDIHQVAETDNPIFIDNDVSGSGTLFKLAGDNIFYYVVPENASGMDGNPSNYVTVYVQPPQ